MQILDSTARWERGTRFYEAEVGIDLFATPCVTVTYGQVQSRRGRRYIVACESADCAADVFKRIAAKRAARKYLPVQDGSAKNHMPTKSRSYL